MADYSRLSKDWIEWSNWMRMSNVSVVTYPDSSICFKSDDDTFYLRDESGAGWIVDRVNERGDRHNDIARFTTFELAEKFLIWRWGSTLTSAPELGRDLYALGMSSAVVARPAEREWYFELQSPEGTAWLSEPSATIFSHIMQIPTEQIERRVHQVTSPH